MADSDDGICELDSGMSGLLVVLNEKLPYWHEKLDYCIAQTQSLMIIMYNLIHLAGAWERHFDWGGAQSETTHRVNRSLDVMRRK